MSKVMVTESYLDDIADAIRTKKGTQDTYTPAEMADAIESISGGGITPTGTINITENGTVDVTQYASAEVNVPSVTPTGTINITQNGTVDVTNYASANVAVPNPSTGTKQVNITQNGTTTEDVTNYANVEITANVSGAYKVAGGTFTLSASSKTVEVEVPFEPTHAFCYGDQADFTQQAWNNYAVILFDRIQPKYLTVIARTNNGTFGLSEMLRNSSDLTYSDGKFKFYDTGYPFIAGRTYTWFCWRENT